MNKVKKNKIGSKEAKEVSDYIWNNQTLLAIGEIMIKINEIKNKVKDKSIKLELFEINKRLFNSLKEEKDRAKGGGLSYVG
jgi:NADPH-dependent 7-cyano-7-deazaguanine reductase QueF-like protein